MASKQKSEASEFPPREKIVKALRAVLVDAGHSWPLPFPRQHSITYEKWSTAAVFELQGMVATMSIKQLCQVIKNSGASVPTPIEFSRLFNVAMRLVAHAMTCDLLADDTYEITDPEVFGKLWSVNMREIAMKKGKTEPVKTVDAKPPMSATKAKQVEKHAAKAEPPKAVMAGPKVPAVPDKIPEAIEGMADAITIVLHAYGESIKQNHLKDAPWLKPLADELIELSDKFGKLAGY